MKNQVYEWVTERIVKALEQGTIPWRRPWIGGEEAPRNLVSGKPYRGINALLLSCSGFASPYFVTYKQATERGGNVKRGESGSMVVFYKLWDTGRVDDKGKALRIPIMRYYKVFNVTQCENLAYPKPDNSNLPQVDPIPVCEAVWSGWNHPEVVTGGRACYSTATDKITMPAMATFLSAAEYYSTLFHEGIHATGHASRIGRDLTGTGSYSREELIAEVGAAMVCGRCGIAPKTIENSAAYCQSWIQRLKGDSKLVVKAAAAAQTAADYIIGQTVTDDDMTDAENEPEPVTA